MQMRSMFLPYPAADPATTMGALADTPHSPALRIQHALDELTTGNSLEYLRLQHTLQGTNPSTLTPILSGLTHFAIKLHHDLPQRPLHTLFNAALQIDLPTIASSENALMATVAFLRNLVSADASFVEPVLQLVTRALLLPVAAREHLMEAVYELIEFLLATHPRAGGLVAQVLRERYPHPVRPTEEHVPYLRGVLAISRRCRSILRALTNLAYERIAAIEALVPHLIDAGVEAEKMENVLLELFHHFDQARGKQFSAVFEVAYEAYEAFVVPCEPRFSPYSILYAAEIGGEAVVRDVVERLRVRFFDRRVSGKLREKFLEHCCGVLVRARSVEKWMLEDWLTRMAEWLNQYIDSAVRRGNDGEVDVDIHHLFYSGFAAFATVVVKRGCVQLEYADMRVGRIVSCGMRPLVMLDCGLGTEFMGIVGESVVWEMDRYRPSRTRFGGRNVFDFGVRLPDLVLPKARQHVQDVVVWDSAPSAEVDTGMNTEDF